jgi:hypothetical protein
VVCPYGPSRPRGMESLPAHERENDRGTESLARDRVVRGTVRPRQHVRGGQCHDPGHGKAQPISLSRAHPPKCTCWKPPPRVLSRPCALRRRRGTKRNSRVALRAAPPTKPKHNAKAARVAAKSASPGKTERVAAKSGGHAKTEHVAPNRPSAQSGKRVAARPAEQAKNARVAAKSAGTPKSERVAANRRRNAKPPSAKGRSAERRGEPPEGKIQGRVALVSQ